MSARIRTALAAAVVALALLVPGPAEAWTPITSSRPVWCDTAPYALGATSSDLGESATERETRAGMDEWTTVSCTSLTTRYAGRTSARAGASDGTSMIGWVESNWRHGGQAIGVTGPRWGGRGCIVEADMEMNGVNYTWTTDSGRGTRVNAFSIVLHEGGHYYGLGHSNDQNATMYFAYTGGIDSLNRDDQTGICTLYPGDGEPPEPECSQKSDCRTGEDCVQGMCQPEAGDGSVCSPCNTASDCGGGADFCLQYPTGGLYCGKLCSSQADCGGDRCVNVSGTGQCIRVDPTTGSPSCTTAPTGCDNDSDCRSDEVCNMSTGACEPAPMGSGLGEPCEDNTGCASGLCLPTPSGTVCSRSCDWLDVGSCPSGFYCDGDAVGACGTGACLAGAAGAGDLGDACDSDTDCASLYCATGVCATPCIPGGASGCPDGFRCQIGAGANCGACKQTGDVGDACDTNEDCTSRICAKREADGATFCTDVCAEDADCRPPLTCDSVGDRRLCVPPKGDFPRPGEPGAPCRNAADCDSQLCAMDGDKTFCTNACTDDSACADGFRCQGTEDEGTRVCAPARRDGGCCSVAAGAGPTARPTPWLLLVLAPLALAWRRKARARR